MTESDNKTHEATIKNDENRRAERFRVETQVSYKVINRQVVKELSASSFHDDGESVNISASGIALSTDIELTKGDYLKIEMRLPQVERTTRALAEVMWIKTDGDRWESGIRFLVILNEADDHSIHQFLETVTED